MIRGAGLLAGVPFANLELASPSTWRRPSLRLGALTMALRTTRRRAMNGPTPPLEHRLAPADPAAPSSPRVDSWRCRCRPCWWPSSRSSSSPGPCRACRSACSMSGRATPSCSRLRTGSRMLIDGGPDPDLLVRRLDERIPVWDRSIDLVVLTHPHEDHSAGLAGLAPRYRIGSDRRNRHAQHRTERGRPPDDRHGPWHPTGAADQRR